jgi:hypothetical protein
MSGNEVGIFRKFSDIKSRGFSVALLRNNILNGKLGVIYSEPLSVYKGSVDIDIPVSRNINNDNVNRSQHQNVSLRADGQERNLEVVYKFNTNNKNGNIDARLLMQEEPNNIKSSKNQYSGLIRYNLSF